MTEEEIWNENKYLIKKMTNLLHFKWREFMDRSDIEDEVAFCLFKAIRSYNVEKSQGKTFTNWAIKIIHQRVHVKVQKIIRDLEASFQHQELASNAWKLPELHKSIKLKQDKPFKNEKSRLRASNRKAEYMKDKECIQCHGKERLLVVHPSIKKSVSLWAITQEKRDKHLSESSIICRTCHTNNRFPDRMKHGTKSMYLHHGCRCKKCKAAYSQGRKKK